MSKRRIKPSGNNNNTFYDEYDKLVSDAGYPNMFNSNWRDDLRK